MTVYKKMKVGELKTIKCGHWLGKIRAITNYARKTGKFFEMDNIDGKTIKVRRVK